MGAIIAGVIVGLAIILVIAFVIRQARRVRRLQSEIDYSRVRRWEDEDDDDDSSR